MDVMRRELNGNGDTTRCEPGAPVVHTSTPGDLAAATSDEDLRTCPVEIDGHRIRHKVSREACLVSTQESLINHWKDQPSTSANICLNTNATVVRGCERCSATRTGCSHVRSGRDSVRIRRQITSQDVLCGHSS